MNNCHFWMPDSHSLQMMITILEPALHILVRKRCSLKDIHIVSPNILMKCWNGTPILTLTNLVWMCRDHLSIFVFCLQNCPETIISMHGSHTSTHIWFTFVASLVLQVWNGLSSCQYICKHLSIFCSSSHFTCFLSGAMCKDGVHQIYLTLEECVHVEGRGLWCWVVWKQGDEFNGKEWETDVIQTQYRDTGYHGLSWARRDQSIRFGNLNPIKHLVLFGICCFFCWIFIMRFLWTHICSTSLKGKGFSAKMSFWLGVEFHDSKDLFFFFWWFLTGAVKILRLQYVKILRWYWDYNISWTWIYLYVFTLYGCWRPIWPLVV